MGDSPYSFTACDRAGSAFISSSASSLCPQRMAWCSALHPRLSCFRIVSLSCWSRQHLSNTEAMETWPLAMTASRGVSPSELTAASSDGFRAWTSLQNTSWPWMAAMWRQVFPWGVVPSSTPGSRRCRCFISATWPPTDASTRRSIPCTNKQTNRRLLHEKELLPITNLRPQRSLHVNSHQMCVMNKSKR